MMFALRGIVITLSLFIVVYCAVSCAVLLTWRRLWCFSQRFSAGRAADVLFGLRMLPVTAAMLLIAAYAVPSFVVLEPRSLPERISGISIGLSSVGLVFALLALGRSIAALRRAARIITAWTRGAQRLELDHPFSVFEVPGCAPVMTAAGIARPKVLLSQTARSLLSPNELHAALNHELVHLRRWDNLKKLLLHLAPFPGMSDLEAMWLEATELAADERAVSNSGEALELASALVKLSRLATSAAPAELTAALVHSPASLVHARVKRLIAWQEQSARRRQYPVWWGICAGAISLALLIFSYAPSLVRMHALTEWMVR